MENVNKNVEVLEVLSNGVERYDLELYPSDFVEANRVLSMGTIGDYVDAYNHYSTRVDNDFVGIYKVRLESTEEYERFRKILSDFLWRTTTFVNIPPITLEQWKNNKIDVGNGRIMKLGKYLKSNGVEQSVLDFYSAQPKIDTKDYFLVISDRVQDIAGMTYYAKNWDSCQNTDRDEIEYNYCLGGSLYDDKLFIAYLVEDMDDLSDMEEKMLARVNMRYISTENVDGSTSEFLVSSRIYGDNITQQLLSKALEFVEEKHILGSKYRQFPTLKLEESVDSTTTLTAYDSILVTIDEYVDVDVECPLCDSNGQYEVYSSQFDKHFDIDCPNCGGSGTFSTEVYISHDEYVEVEDVISSRSYADDYTLRHDSMSIRVNEELFFAHLVEYGIVPTKYADDIRQMMNDDVEEELELSAEDFDVSTDDDISDDDLHF